MDELNKIVKKDTEISTAQLDTVYKLIESIKGIDKIFMLNEVDAEYGNSYARRRDSRGRYSGVEWPIPTRSRNRYSRTSKYEELLECLEEMKEHAPSEKALEAIETVEAQIRLGE